MTQKPQTNTNRRPKVGRPGATCAVALEGSTFTRPRGGTGRSYVASKSKTDSEVLHQPRTLKASAADNARDRTETGGGRRATGKLAGNMVEVSGVTAQAVTPVTSVPLPGGEFAGRKVGSGRVFVLGKTQQPLMPCHPARARQLLKSGRAVIARAYPFVIRLKARTTGATQPVALKLDPGATHTGVAIVRLATLNSKQQHVLFTAELTYRGSAIRDSLTQRSSFRRSRRARKTRYRAPRFLNRGGDKCGWLPPSLRHRLETTASLIARLRRYVAVTGLAMELVRFDLQALQDPEIRGVEYQQGCLAGYEVREYVFEKCGRICSYCDAEHVPLNLDHIVPKARGGSNRVSNLTPACIPCNTRKGQQDICTFLAHDPARLARLLATAKKPLSAAAAVNATRFALRDLLLLSGLPVVTSTGGRTKWNRTRFDLPKTHALDAACVGEVDSLSGHTVPLLIRCTGRGSRKRTRLTAHGFPRGYLSPAKAHFGFRTGDIVSASVPTGKRRGTYHGRVAVRASGRFNIQTDTGTVQGITHRFCSHIQRADGYAYALNSQPKLRGFRPAINGRVSATSQR